MKCLSCSITAKKQTYVKGQYGLGGAWHDQGAGYESRIMESSCKEIQDNTVTKSCDIAWGVCWPCQSALMVCGEMSLVAMDANRFARNARKSSPA